MLNKFLNRKNVFSKNVHDLREPLQTINWLVEKSLEKDDIKEIKNCLNEINILNKHVNVIISNFFEEKAKLYKIEIITLLNSVLRYTDHVLIVENKENFIVTNIQWFKQVVTNIIYNSCGDKIHVNVFEIGDCVSIKFKYKQKNDIFFEKTNKFLCNKLNYRFTTKKSNNCFVCEIKIPKSKETIKKIKSNITVIVCEDDDANNFILTETLKSMGIRCIKSFKSGEKCLQYITKTNEEPDIFMLDIVMSGLSGDELCKKIKDLKLKSKFIAVTGSLIVDKKLDCFDDIITKPYGKRELKESLIKLKYLQL